MTRFETTPLAECLNLLSSARFTTTQNLFLRGEQTGATIISRPDSEQPGGVVIDIVCHTSGHLRLDWDGIGILLEDSGAGTIWVSFLDRNGRARFRVPVTTAPAYRLETSLSSARSEEELEAVPRNMRGRGGQANLSAPTKYEVHSRDGLLRAIARRHPNGVLEVRVDTEEALLKNSRAYVEFRNARSDTLLRCTIDLKFQTGNLIYGQWMFPPAEDLPENATMYVTAFRRASRGEK